MLRICLATAEFTPLAKTGGLADVTAGLSRYLSDIGQDVRVFLPCYGTIDTSKLDLVPVEFLDDVEVDLGVRRERFSVSTAAVPDSPHRIHLIHCPRLFGRQSIYSGEGDEHLRFAMLCQAVLRSCQQMGWAPHVVHCHDWHTSLIPLYLRTVFEWDDLFRDTQTLLTIHNLGYQGKFTIETLPAIGLEEYRHFLWGEDVDAGVVNFLKTGIVYAGALTTVSRSYAREIQTPEHGCGLHELLQARNDHLFGIVNGVEYRDWDPTVDPLIPASFSRDDLSGKRECKSGLLSAVGLPNGDRVPTIGMVSRLTAQKGLELLFETLPEMLGALDVRLVVLGSGEDRFESYFTQLQSLFPSKVCYYRGFNNDLAHLIEAGSDMFLMPSHFEPCGLNQMYSLRYGTVPIVHKTGGLADTVEPWNPDEQTGTGFLFEHFTTDGVRWALAEALKTYRDEDAWQKLMRNGMSKDFSWQRQGREYLALMAKLSGQ